MKTLNELLILIKSVAENHKLEVKPDFDDLDERDEFFGRVWFDYDNNGICDTLFNAACHYNDSPCIDRDDVRHLIKEHFSTWEHFSGDVGFPVEVSNCDIEFNNRTAYWSNAKRQYYVLNHWEGEAYTLRISLLDHLIKCTK